MAKGLLIHGDHYNQVPEHQLQLYKTLHYTASIWGVIMHFLSVVWLFYIWLSGVVSFYVPSNFYSMEGTTFPATWSLKKINGTQVGFVWGFSVKLLVNWYINSFYVDHGFTIDLNCQPCQEPKDKRQIHTRATTFTQHTLSSYWWSSY